MRLDEILCDDAFTKASVFLELVVERTLRCEFQDDIHCPLSHINTRQKQKPWEMARYPSNKKSKKLNDVVVLQVALNFYLPHDLLLKRILFYLIHINQLHTADLLFSRSALM